jgi:hypothetical protein
MSDNSKDIIIATLKERVKKLEKENKELNERLKIDYGRIYESL